MRRKGGWISAFLGAACLWAATLEAAPCAPSATALCLSGGRFEVKVTWKDFQARTGDGQAIPLTADTGYFWFFSASNVELIVKVLDARAINQKFWVFFGALSNVEYTLRVTDSVTGAVKTYQNPSGQFASVGDTSAFAGSGSVGVASYETVVAKGTAAPPDSLADIQRFIDRSGPAAAAFTPCPGPSNTLYLSNCRFRLEAHWTDARGRNGSGQAVQLTSDTGYFWFFNETNVELMVKVLDARPINGKFWVFFGALSNVEYTINVVDTVSGALRSYHNPQSTFASVGDTAAFRGGYAISVETDSARSVSGTVTAAGGGSLSATAADGTVFTLVVPPAAVFDDQDITMTPVGATGAFPFAAGLAAGVDLRPSGLVILPGATLSIHTPTAISRSEETPVAWNGSGEDFFLFPPTPAGGDLELFIEHFGGYGVARGTDAEREIQLGREPVGDDDLVSHQTSPLLRQGRAAVPGAVTWAPQATPDWRSGLIVAYDTIYGLLREQILATDGDPGVVLKLVLQTLNWKYYVEHFLGPVDTVYPGREEEIRSLLERIVKLALDKIHTDCKLDPSKITTVLPLANLAEQSGLNIEPDLTEALQCLTFKLRFESTIKDDTVGVDRPGHIVITNTALAELTLETKRELPSGFIHTEGEGTIKMTEISVSVTGLPPGYACSYTYASTPAPFRAKLLWWNLYRADIPFGLTLQYAPGFPGSTIVQTCPHGDPEEAFSDLWQDKYYDFHEAGVGGPPGDPLSFLQRGWTLTGAADSWAKAESNQSKGTNPKYTEATKFKLTHTPR